MEDSALQKACKRCGDAFAIVEWDLSFYKKVGVPAPSLCPNCREQRRCVHINQLNLFKRSCDATKASIISHHPPESPYKVYSLTHWHSDAFDGSTFGRNYDFGRPFFEQFAELSRAVPRPALFNDFLRDENSAYTNYAGKNKNCYLIFDSDENWDCLYSYGINSCKNSSDCYRSQQLELCYETVDSNRCYGCAFTHNSENCWESIFLNNCIGCKNCVMCSNLRHKEFYIENKPASKEEVERLKALIGSFAELTNMAEDFADFKLQFPQKYMRGVQNENVSGNHLVHCKNAYECFDCMNLWDAKYCAQSFMKSKDCMDAHECGDAELIYECTNLGYNAFNLRFSMQCLNQVTNLTYCDTCFNGCSDLFGCVGLKRKKYCILNKQYSKEEYEELVPRIIEHMSETGEWGEFFPSEMSTFAYNISMAQEISPLTKKEALAQGFQWRDKDKTEYQAQTYEIPDHINQLGDDILKQTLACVACSKNFKLTGSEIKLYRKLNLPAPRRCFLCRHNDRLLMRNPRHLWQRNCTQCQAEILTSYAPARPEAVYCERCYSESLS